MSNLYKPSLGKRLLVSASIIVAQTAFITTNTAFAQDSVDEIIVTGSRIPLNPNLTSPVPVQTLDGDEFRLSGEISLADVINDVPALVSSLTAENSLTGANALNLRGLGGDRTLTLVNGRRHVSGFEGSQAVDIGSIPQALIERVDVLTGGASAIYGSDAVTGVVNFILKEDFEGLDVDVRGGISDKGDAENFSIRGVVGKNFHQDRGNITFAVDYIEDSELLEGDRRFTRDGRVANDIPNPALATDPSAPPRAFGDFSTFSISSASSLIVARDFGPSGLDLNGNGVEDCDDSSVGGNIGFGLAGCFVVDQDGTVRPFQDGAVGSVTNQFGGDGIRGSHNGDTLIPSVDTLSLNLNASYEITPKAKVFVEGKYSSSEASTRTELNGFFDLLTIAPDNPFIPAVLQNLADDRGGLFVSRDPIDLITGEPDTTERETFRIVGGVKGEFDNGWNYEVSGNYGEFTSDTNDENFLLLDRYFAAIDVVNDASGNPVCRTDIDPTATPPTTPFGIPAFDAGIFSFTPGDGQCRPLNILAGPLSASPEAVSFVTTQVQDQLTLTQTVFSASLAGDSQDYFNLPAGPIGFAVGVEYREETSENRVNDFDQGILPQGTPFTAGALISSVSDNESLGFNGGTSRTLNSEGEYDVFDVFGEIRIPLVNGKKFFEDLSVDGAIRYADYSTIGGATTWKLGANWVVDNNLSFRGTLSQAIRAPNIDELFSPEQPITARPVDPCDATIIPTATNPDLRQANCLADGIPVGFVDPLTARFTGVSGGNPNLGEETADTITIGAIYRPHFIDRLSLTVDYWDVRIDNIIANVSVQNIVDECYDAPDFPNQFCQNVTRNRDASSPIFLGFNFVRQSTINFARSEASGIDFSANYNFDLDENQFGFRVVGSRQLDLDNFFNPSDLTDVNPELGELQRPKWSGNATVSWARGPISAAVQGTYQSRQTLRGAEIETVVATFGPTNGFSDESYVFDANASYEWNDNFTFYGGVNNFTDEEPFSTERAVPVGPRGRFFFGGVRITY